jgi:MFS family permease
MESAASADSRKKRGAWFRWVVLCITGSVTLATYFAYDTIGPLATEIKDTMGVGDTEIGLLNSAYSFAALFMILPAGILIDRYGIKKMGIVICLVFILGTILTAGGIGTVFFVMLAGRFFFGLGSESFYVAQNKMIAKWFKGKELALAFGLSIAVGRFGTVAAQAGLPWVLNAFEEGKALWVRFISALVPQTLTPVRGALWLAVALCVLSFIAFLVYVLFDRKRGEDAPADPDEPFRWSDVYRFNASFWYIALLCGALYVAIFTLTNFSITYFENQRGLSKEMAGGYTALLTFTAMIATPLMGLLIDRYGRRATFMAFGSFIMVPAFLALGFLPVTAQYHIPLGFVTVPFSLLPVIPLLCLGIAFCLVPAALWASVPLIIEERRLATAYALITLVQQIGWILALMVFGFLSDRTGNYHASFLFLTSLGVLGVVFSVLLKRSVTVSGHSALEDARAK